MYVCIYDIGLGTRGPAPVVRLAGWLGGWLAGWGPERPRDAQRGPERSREAQRASERPKPKSGQFYQQVTYWEAGFLKGPNSRKKAPKRPLVAPSQKVTSSISNSHVGKPFFEGPQFPKKGLQRPTGRPRPKSGQFYQQLTYWEAAFLKGPNSLKKASKKPLVVPSQKVASFISNSHIGKPLF